MTGLSICSFCGEKYDFAKCWRDPAHGVYYAAETKRRAAVAEQPPVEAGLLVEVGFVDGAVQEPLL